jgi:hypothetical protein
MKPRTIVGIGLVGLALLAVKLRSLRCILGGGHNTQVYRGPTHLCLRCTWCGHSSPGWEVGRQRR